jgi:hypothetical protein
VSKESRLTVAVAQRLYAAPPHDWVVMAQMTIGGQAYGYTMYDLTETDARAMLSRDGRASIRTRMRLWHQEMETA